MEERQGRLGRLATATAILALLFVSPGANAKPYAPLDQPGPPLGVPRPQLQAALQCEPGVRNAKVEPVLLNPGTGTTPTVDFGWNWEPALDRLRIPWCAYTPPHYTLDRIDTSGEYLVYAIRTMHALAHRRIAILGHSQGGMSMRWALRFWPDTRPMVEDVIGLAPSNHGTTVGGPGACRDGCPAADWQQFQGAAFFKALNSRTETFPGISYSNIYTHTDELVKPDTGSTPSDCSSCLFTGAGRISNVATQNVCPNDRDEHLMVGTVDPVSYALGVDAMTHPGPAKRTRIPGSVCSQLFMPGLSQASFNAGLAAFFQGIGAFGIIPGPGSATLSGAPTLASEPTLQCYVFADCRGGNAPTLKLTVKLARGRGGAFSTLRVLVRTREGQALVPVPGVTVTIAGQRVKTGHSGRATLRVRLRGGHRYTLRARRAGCNPARARI